MGNFSLLTTLTLNAAGFSKGIDQAKKDTKTLQIAAANATESVKNSFSSLAAPIMEQFGGLQKLTSGLGGVAGAAKSMIPVLGLLKTAMIAIPLIAIVTAVISLITWFSKTNEGTSIFTKAINVVKAVIQTVLGTLKMLGEAIVKLFKGDFKGAAEAAKQAFTGVGDRLQENLDRAKELSALMDQMAKRDATNQREQAEMTRDASVLWEKVTDTESYSATERLKFLQEYKAKLEDIRKDKEQDIAIEIEKYTLENGGIKKITESNTLLKGYNDLVVKRLQSEWEYNDALAASNKKQKTLTTEAEKEVKTAKELAASRKMTSEAMPTLKPIGPKPIKNDIGKVSMDLPLVSSEKVQQYQAMVTTIITINEQFKSSFRTLSEVFADSIYTLVNVLNKGAKSFKDYGKSVLSSIKDIIAGYIAEAVAKAIMSQIEFFAKLGPIGLALMPIAAAAGAGLVKTAFNSLMPKFETGGIVGGFSFSGDKVPALVNSGEMILNTGQQANLFKMLNQGSNSGKVTFEIGYDKLIGVLNNGGKKVNSYR